jgi:predicted transcriptional regulator
VSQINITKNKVDLDNLADAIEDAIEDNIDNSAEVSIMHAFAVEAKRRTTPKSLLLSRLL